MSFLLKNIIRNELEILCEDYLSDIKYNNIAKKIYRKIIKNINNIKFSPISDSNKQEFITDSTGKKHVLYGVKFNINQLDKNFNIDIYLARILPKINAYHHYDPKNKRIVFFIINEHEQSFEHDLYFAKLRFSNWIDENTFIHEFIHYLDSIRYTDTYNYNKPKNKYDYYNTPEEFNAFTHMIISQILKNKKKFMNIPFKLFLNKSLKLADNDFIKYINDKNKIRLFNRLYNLYLNIK